ncbi:hypothetical protein GCM10007096_34430 [Pullulanibacillus pueri]|uniref:Uncharacterized protein n=1 Tax=Pullulanibacillus pueri TaxID=1437324 RepID=A0A8J2ZYT2_9BACL|nr:hypothetical protein GCM10007096_34430 [Pullulanibacillus pueri]
MCRIANKRNSRLALPFQPSDIIGERYELNMNKDIRTLFLFLNLFIYLVIDPLKERGVELTR